ncbi:MULTISPECIES: transcriptional regulator [Pseudacidovorax]|uniref:transcriptional regulator n=1 Tax=Pseudacidovorax TaxID=433923 RepID=UPI001F4591C0|nr:MULTISPECIES: transcriptional regulator [Pseudacidovorax]
MFTVSETRAFVRTMEAVWRGGEREAFIDWIARNPLAGDLIVGSGGLRKVRWSRPGTGRRGGTRVITYTLLDEGQVWLLVGYTKARFDNLPTEFLVRLRKEIDDAATES